MFKNLNMPIEVQEGLSQIIDFLPGVVEGQGSPKTDSQHRGLLDVLLPHLFFDVPINVNCAKIRIQQVLCNCISFRPILVFVKDIS